MTDKQIIKDQTTTTRWFSKTIDVKTALTIVGGLLSFIVACSFFYWKSEAAWEKQHDDKVEVMALIKALEEKVNRQYSTATADKEKILQAQKEDKDREFQMIEEVADWMHEQIGRQQAIDEMKKR